MSQTTLPKSEKDFALKQKGLALKQEWPCLPTLGARPFLFMGWLAAQKDVLSVG